MLFLSFVLLLIAALFGRVLGALHLQTERKPPARTLGALHGLLGIVGFVVLLSALNGPPRGEALGVGSFGRIAAVLLATAVIAGLAILLARRRYPRLPAFVIGIHATLAVSGVVVLAAYTLLG